MSEEEEAEVVDSEEGAAVSEEEPPEVEDPQEVLREKCRPKCQHHFDKLEECNERVNSKTSTREICMEELIDLLECVEHCVAEKLFLMLK